MCDEIKPVGVSMVSGGWGCAVVEIDPRCSVVVRAGGIRVEVYLDDDGSVLVSSRGGGPIVADGRDDPSRPGVHEARIAPAAAGPVPLVRLGQGEYENEVLP